MKRMTIGDKIREVIKLQEVQSRRAILRAMYYVAKTETDKKLTFVLNHLSENKLQIAMIQEDFNGYQAPAGLLTLRPLWDYPSQIA